MSAAPPHPASVQRPTGGDDAEAGEREPAVLVDAREGEGGGDAEDLEGVDDGGLDSREARAAVRAHQGLRELLGRERVHPDAEAREREEGEED